MADLCDTCGHRWHRGACKVQNPKDDCDCEFSPVKPLPFQELADSLGLSIEEFIYLNNPEEIPTVVLDVPVSAEDEEDEAED